MTTTYPETHQPPPGLSQIPVTTHGDPAPPPNLHMRTITSYYYPATIYALNLVREDNGGPSWPSQDSTRIPDRWRPYLPQIERGLATLSATLPAPEDHDACSRYSVEAPSPLDCEFRAFVTGEDTVAEAIARRSVELFTAHNFLNDFFEGWTLYDDKDFNPQKDLIR